METTTCPRRLSRNVRVTTMIAVVVSLLAAACGPSEDAAPNSRVKNAALPGADTGTSTPPSAPPQVFLKIDTIDETPIALQGTPRFVAKLRWSEPLNDGGTPVTGYEIQFRWNSFEAKKPFVSMYREWTSCSRENQTVPGSFPACSTARTSTATTAEIHSPIWQRYCRTGERCNVQSVSHLVQGLEYRVAAINKMGTGNFSPPTQQTCKYGGACEFGDLGPGGGVVYDVPAATESATGWKSNGASEVAGADWEYSANSSWASMVWAAETECPGWSCYAPTPPTPCAKTKTTPVKYAANPATCLTRDAWHLPFAMPLINVAEWRPLCNKFDELASTWGRLRGGPGFFYWSASNVVLRAGLSVDVNVGTIVSLVAEPGPGVLVEMANQSLDRFGAGSLKSGQAIRFPCDSTTKSVTGSYNNDGRLYTNDGKTTYHDNSVRTNVTQLANLSRPIRTFTTNRPGIAPQIAPVVTAAPADGGVKLTWTAGTADPALATKMATAQVLPFTDYAVEYKKSSASTWTRLAGPPSVSMVRIIGNGLLESGASYDFRVAEVNSLGTGPVSRVATATPGRFFQNTLGVVTQSGAFPSVVLATRGGNGTGQVSFTATDGTARGCSVQGDRLAVLQVGTCNVVATKAADAQFLAATSAPTVVNIVPGPQAPLAVRSTSGPFDKPLSLQTTGGSGTGAVAFAVVDSDRDICSINGDVLTFTPRFPGTGSCRVYATKAASTNHVGASTVITNINFTAGSQAPIVVDTPAAVSVPVQKVAVTARGGSGTGEATFRVRNGTARNCAVSLTNERGGVISAEVSANNFGLAPETAGTCIVSVTRAADANYQAATSVDAVVTFKGGVQAALVLNDPTIGSRGGFDLSTRGGSGSGTVTYSIATNIPVNTTWALAKNCRIVGSKLLADTVGGCWVTATKAGDVAYEPTTSASREYSLTRADQPPLVVTVAPSSGPVGVGTNLTLSTTGGGGDGSVSFEVRDGSASGCLLTNKTISARTVGTCTVVAKKSSDANFWEARAEASFTFTKGSQATLSLASGLRGRALTLGEPVVLSTNGGSGTGQVTFTVTDKGTAKCTVDGNKLTAKAAGSCSVTATKAGDDSYNEATSAASVIPFDVRLGDTGPAGGVIAHVADVAKPWGRYIEIAPDSWNGGADPATNWARAIELASSYRGGGRLDWRLPSDEEKNLLTGKGYLYDPKFSYGYWSYDGLGSNWNPDRKVRPIRTFG